MNVVANAQPPMVVTSMQDSTGHGRPAWEVLLTQPVRQAAQSLLGAHLTANGVTVRIVEVEAYAGFDDPASHAFRGRTRRNASMFGPVGTLYVYFSYGMHWCANITCGPEGTVSAALLRAGEVLDGQATARARTPTKLPDSKLASGPARLCRSLGIHGDLDGSSVLERHAPAHLSTADASWPVSPERISSGPRVGISVAEDWPWRFWVEGSYAVSSFRPGRRA